MFQVLCRQSKGEPNRFSVVSKQLRRWISRKPFRNYDGKGENLYFKRHIARVIDSWKLKEFENWLIEKKKIEVKDFWNRFFILYYLLYSIYSNKQSFRSNVRPVRFLRLGYFFAPCKELLVCAHAYTHAHARHEPVRYIVRKPSRPRRWDIRSRNMRQDEKYAVVSRGEIAVRIVACYPAKIPTMYIVLANEIQ